MLKIVQNFSDIAISELDTSNVTDMSQMFSGAGSFNQNLSGWNVEEVTDYTDFATGSNLADENKPKFK